MTEPSVPAPPRDAARITSMDQFRGFTVAGMFVVNFCGGLDAVPAVLKHHNTYFSLADTIMPSFMFACGFSYRLSMLRRFADLGTRAAYRHAIVRSLALVLVSLILFGGEDLGGSFKSFHQFNGESIREFAAKTLKADLWEVLAIIGVAQLLILPVIGKGPRARLATLALFLIGHGVLTYAFNWNFVHGRPNVFSDHWGAATARAWDGGLFGPLMWAVPMLAGTLVFDLMSARSARSAAAWLLLCGCAVMGVGYLLSCGTRLYDTAGLDPSTVATLDASPVIPPRSVLDGRTAASLLAEPPFVPPPPDDVRRPNYWRMDKRIVSAGFTVFSTGYAIALYGLFVVLCDVASLQLGVFRTLGRNPLAAYIIHHLVEHTVLTVVPGDSPLWYDCAGLAVFLLITYLCVRYLEAHRLYLRL